MMMEVQVPGQSYNYSSWYIKICKNAMAIAYIGAYNPPYLHNLTVEEADPDHMEWWDVLNQSGVTYGRADPYQDPCGYRTLMVWGLADDYYHGILENDWDNDTINASMWRKDPYIMGYGGADKTVCKSKETDLISTLQGGEINYLFIYRSVALQHGLEYYRFNDYQDLSNASKEDFYANVTVSRISPLIAEQDPDVTAKPIVYGITIPNTAPNFNAAVEYVKFILGSPGVWIQNYQIPIWPCLASNVSLLPIGLQDYCVDDPVP